jgi:hypothetical protein
MPLTRIKSLGITDGTIVNADIDTAAAIATSKLGAGAVLQVVQATYSTATTTSSGTFSDTGMSASITPSSSSNKILILANHTSCYKTGGDTNLKLQLVRGSTSIAIFENAGGYTGSSVEINFGTCSVYYLDSPSTTSSTTYKTQMRADNGATVGIQRNSAFSSITLIEIKA